MLRLMKQVMGPWGRQLSKYRFSGGYFSHRDEADNNDSTPFDFTDENYKQIDIILKKFPSNWKRSAIIPLLHLAQKQNNNFLSLNAMKKIAKITQVNDMDVYEVASFYTMFNRQRVGKYHLQICGTTPCQLRGSEQIIKACEDYIGVKCGQTSPDMKFTIQEVECLGACANAPMLQVNGEWVYEDLTPANTIELLKKLEQGTDKKGPQIIRNDCEGPEGRTTLVDKDVKKEVRHERDFAKAKKDWDEAETLRLSQEKRKAEQARKIDQERRRKIAEKKQ